jgi:acyl-ACP thioesterase
MEPIFFWNEEIIVKTYETDFTGKWQPAFLLASLTEIAAHHAAHLGFDYPGMLQKDLIWVLSRIKIRFLEPMGPGLKISVKTWPKGIQQKIFFMRDFELRGPDGSLLALASTAWLLISPRARRMLPPAALTAAYPGMSVPDNQGMSAVAEPLEKISIPDGLPEQMTVEARYNMLDLLGHVNSARYADWVCNCFPLEMHAGRKLAWLLINYANEVRPGEQVSIQAGTAEAEASAGETTWLVQGSNRATGLRAFEAAAGWNPA